MNKKTLIITVAVLLIVIVTGSIFFGILSKKDNKKQGKKQGNLDNWEYINNSEYTNISNIYETNTKGTVFESVESSSVSVGKNSSSVKSDNLGFTVGGSQNIKNFRSNIEKGYLPLTTDITYNGVFSEYYFDTASNRAKSNKMFYPSYSFAQSTDPISKEKEYYMSVGLNSNIKESDFKRPKVNLVVVLDISCSMSSSIIDYYYDKKENQNIEENDKISKMELAEKCLCNLVDKLKEDDRLGIVLFDNQAYLGQKITTVGDLDLAKLKNHIMEVKEKGGTNFEAGYEKGTNLFEDIKESQGYQNRIIVITDAMPNLGNTLGTSIKDNSKKGIYTSFIGVGVDFNTQLIENLSDVEGANYYSVHNAKEFNKTLAEEFDYMITPLVFDLDLKLKSNDFEIEAVYGSDTVNKSNGSIMHINTLFPSASNESGEVKGGIVILKLKKKGNGNSLVLETTYKNAEKVVDNDIQNVEFDIKDEDYYDNTGIRKGIALARYVNVMKKWIDSERAMINSDDNNDIKIIRNCYYDEENIERIFENYTSQYERKSVKLNITEENKEKIKQLESYMRCELEYLENENFDKEFEILNKLIK